MKVAFLIAAPAVGAPADAERAIGSLLPHLRARLEVDIFVEPSAAREDAEGRPARSVSELDPQAYDQVLYAIWNDARCGFFYPFVRDVGGTVALFDWCLADATRAAYPETSGSGARARWRLLREGGSQAVREAGGTGAQRPALNRSIVRRADCFLVPSDAMRAQVLAERNEPTPIAVADPRAGAADAARVWAEALSRFPRHRAARKSVLRHLVEALGRRAGPAAQGSAAGASKSALDDV